MALVVADRVKETTSTTGTGDLSLGGAPANFITFGASLSDGDTTYYAIVDNTNVDYEVGVGTYTSSTDSLSRDTVFESSNSNAKVNLQVGQKDVFITYPASKSVLLDASGEVLGNQTFAGSVTLNADPTSALQAATKQYVDDTAAEGIQYHSPVRVEQEGNLTATYNNGTAGVGATLTNAGTQAALVIDGITMVVNDRVLIYEQTDATQNGIYDVTNTGSASTNWVLTRSADADSYAPSDPNALAKGSGFFVEEGLLGAGEKYVCNTTGTITFGTTDITFVQVASSQVYTGGTGISINGSQISSDITLAEVTANGATTTDNVTFGNITGNTLVSNSITYPTADGSTGQFIKTDGAGTLSFATALTATPTLDAVTTAGNNTANNITVGNINASDVSCNALTSTGIDDNATSTAITIDSSGNVGVGTSSPAVEVEVASAAPQLRLTDTDGGYCEVTNVSGNLLLQADKGNSQSSSYVRFDVDGSEAVRIDSSGNVGIGTASPAYELSVVATAANADLQITNTTVGTTSSDGLTLTMATNGNATINNRETSGNLIFSNSGSERMRIDSSGNVGIGVTDPDNLLTVGGGTQPRILIRANGDAGASQLNFGDASDIDVGRLRYDHSDNSMGFFTSATERMRIDSSGNVGIGTTSPDSILHLSGSSASKIIIENSTSPRGNYIGISGADNLVLAADEDNLGASSSMQFRVDATEHMRIGTGGNVGIGTTTPAHKLHVESSVSGDWVSQIHNTHATNGYGLKVRAGDNGDVYSFYVADVNNTGLFTVRGGGYVGIGNNSPQRKLNIHESAASTGVWSQFTNAQTGTASGAGTLVGIDSSQDFRILNYENTDLRFYTNGTERMTVGSNGNVSMPGQLSTGELTVTSASARSINAASTGTSSYIKFMASTSTIRGYVGNGPALITGAANSDFIVRSQASLKFATNGNTLAGTINTSGDLTMVGSIAGSNLVRNVGDFGSIAVSATRGGYYGLSLNGGPVFMSNGSAHGIYDDTNNEWWVRLNNNAGVDLRYNGSTKLDTTSAGVDVTGEMQSDTLRVTGTSRLDGIVDVGSYIRHVGDTNTYIRFVAGDDLQLVAGGRQMIRMDEGTNPDLLEFVVSTTYTDSSGNIVASGNVTAYASDKRLKTNIKPIENALDKVMSIKGVHYDWIDDVEDLGFHPDRKIDNIGVIAQEIEEVLPQIVKAAPFDQHRSADTNWEFVSKSGEDYKTVDYDKLTALLIEAVKELKAEVDELKRAAA